VTFLVLAPLVVALGAAAWTWALAGRLDRQSLRRRAANAAEERHRWGLVLAGLTAAVLAATVLQVRLLEGFRP